MEDYNEMSLKDIILEIQSIIKLLINQWVIILLASLLLGGIYGFIQLKKPEMYMSKLTFMMDEKTGNNIPGLELLGSLFGGGGSSGDNMGKILELFESKKIINETVLQKTIMNGKEDHIGNHLIDVYGLENLVNDYKSFGILWSAGWPKQLLGKENVRFTHSNVDSFEIHEELLLRLCFEKINGNDKVGLPQLLTSELNAESGIMTLNMKSENEGITLGILNNIYNQLSEFFIQKTIEKQLKTYEIVSDKMDSIVSTLKVKEYALANFKDQNRKLVTVKGYLDQLRLERDVQVLNIMYGEIIKQMEATDFALKNKTPVVQVIDKPRSPLFPVIPSVSYSFKF